MSDHRRAGRLLGPAGCQPALVRALSRLSLLMAEGMQTHGWHVVTAVPAFLWWRLCGALNYRAWVRRDRSDSAGFDDRIQRFDARFQPPLISVLMPVYNPPAGFESAVAAVVAQVYPHWELLIIDDHSTAPEAPARLKAVAAGDRRIRILWRERNGHIAAATNSGLQAARGTWCALLDQDDLLPPHALLRVAEALEISPDTDLLYSDEDKIDAAGHRYDPYFKPAWNPDLILVQNFVSHLGVYRTALMREIGGLRPGYDGSQDHDLVLRFAARTSPERIRHIPEILYHWRSSPGSLAYAGAAKPYAHAAARRALQDHLDQNGWPARVGQGYARFHRVRFIVPTPEPPVTVILPWAADSGHLSALVSGILWATDYASVELLVLGGEDQRTRLLSGLDRDDRRLRFLPVATSESNASRCNRGAAAARGRVLVFLSAQLRVLSAGWLEILVGHALRTGIGAVGPLIRDRRGCVRHAGLVLGMLGIAASPGYGLPLMGGGHKGRLRLMQTVSAVGADGLTCRREVFDGLGGFDADAYPGALFALDYCLRLHAAGYRVLYLPDVEWLDLQPATTTRWPRRLPPDSPEWTRLRERWGTRLDADPFFNPNFRLDHPHWLLRLPAPPARR